VFVGLDWIPPMANPAGIIPICDNIRKKTGLHRFGQQTGFVIIKHRSGPIAYIQ